MSTVPVKLTDGTVVDFHVDALLTQQVFELIKEGKMTVEQLDEWVDAIRDNSYESGYDAGCNNYN